MSGYPERVSDVGRLIDLGYVTLTTTPVAVAPSSRPVVAIAIQNTEAQGNAVLVGDAIRQSMQITGGNTYTVRAADAAQVYVRAAAGTVVVAVHILEP